MIDESGSTMPLLRATATFLSALTLAGSAWANTSYTVGIPTADPYTRFENHVAAGEFSDSFNFTLSTPTSGYIWLFARQDAWFGFDQVEDTEGVSLVLVNNLTEREYRAVLFPEAQRTVSLLEPGVMGMVVAGFDPNKTLFLSGDFAAGSYSAFVSGTATGSAGSSYIAKFSFAQPVPEPGSMALMLVGLGAVAWVVHRQSGQCKPC